MTRLGTATIHFVDGGAPSGGDGSSWEHAFDAPHDALAAAAPGDSVWVAAGVYTPGPPGGDRAAAFTIPGGVSVYGGFAGDEMSLDEREAGAATSVLSGDLNGDDGPGFAGRDDNAWHVVVAGGDPMPVLLDGFTITAGEAGGGSGPTPLRNGGGLYVDAGAITLRRCIFHANRSLATAALSGGGAVYARESPVVFEECAFTGNAAPNSHGAAVRLVGATSASVSGCVFQGNEADVGGALSAQDVGSLVLDDSAFVGNTAEAGGGGVFVHDVGDATVTACVFSDNDGGYTGGGLIVAGESSWIERCRFTSNAAASVGGALGVSAEATIVNCVLSRNRASGQGGAAVFSGTATVVQCSFGGNEGGAILVDADAAGVAVRNCVLWGNGPSPFRGPVVPDVAHCLVEGGVSGPGNVDADPVFVQAGTDDLRLAFGSPAIDAGDTDAIPAGVATDLDGNPRIAGATVDMGAHEGAHEPMPAAAMVTDLDTGEIDLAVFGGEAYDPLHATALVVENVGGPDDAHLVAMDLAIDAHPDDEGYAARGGTITVDTSLPDGAFRVCVMRPFAAADLDGANPSAFDLIAWDENDGAWMLAVAANAAPIGDRVTVTGPGYPGLTTNLGDHGVYWDPSLGAGFVWANVDHVLDTSYGVRACAADVAQPPDGAVGWADLLAVISAWGMSSTTADVNHDGVVDMGDVLSVMGSWGGCE
ncbi:MAG: hypothetical protein GY715_16715 [Planctomycetes bacterium]|nr:hypothetical protein [Planctomycetota bacterium]